MLEHLESSSDVDHHNNLVVLDGLGAVEFLFGHNLDFDRAFVCRSLHSRVY